MITGVCGGDRTQCEAEVRRALFWYLVQRGPFEAAVTSGHGNAADLLDKARTFARETATEVVTSKKRATLSTALEGVEVEIVWTVDDVTGGAAWTIGP